MGLQFFSPRGFFGLKFLCPRFLGPRFSVSYVIGTKVLLILAFWIISLAQP